MPYLHVLVCRVSHLLPGGGAHALRVLLICRQEQKQAGEHAGLWAEEAGYSAKAGNCVRASAGASLQEAGTQAAD
jgi:hypothetical protein